MIVVDTNVVAALLLDGPDTSLARRAWKKDRDWVLPSLWRAELLNVLWMGVRTDAIANEDAIRAWRHAWRLLKRAERPVDDLAVLRTALRFGITAYDAHFVALADALGVLLVTNDRKSLADKCPESLVVVLSSFVTP